MITKQEAIRKGARGMVIPTMGLRKESFDWLKLGRPIPKQYPVRLHVYPDAGIVIHDGRHRILLARERGETEIRGRIVAYGKRGGQLWSYTGRFPI